MDRLILFDIDGTLTTGPGHRDAFSHALRVVYGIDASQPREGNPGMTDWQIILDILTEKGLGRQEISEKIKECMDEMARYYEASMPNRTVGVHDGVEELLSELESMAVMIGLVTGNVEGVAWAKLGKAGIGHYFKMGGFGSDDISRTNLVRLAVRRAVKLGFNPHGKVFVVGDTPRDIEAGRRASARTVGVATGSFSREELKSAGADFVLDSLEDKEGFLEIIS